MEAANPFESELTKDEGALDSHGENLVTDDRTIYEELIAPLENTMMRTIWRIVRNADLAEDCLQDALYIVWKKRFRIRSHPNPPAFILKICLNAAYDSLRGLARMRRQTDLSRLGNTPAPQEHNADHCLGEREIEEQVQRAIRRLPRKRALAVMMRMIQGEPFDVIARALDCSEVTVRIHVSKGRAQLKKWLSPAWSSSREEVGNE